MIETAKVVEVKNVGTPEKTREAIFDELRRDLAEWMTTDRDLVWRPAIELTKEDDEFAARSLMPGVDPKDIEVMVSPERLLIRGETHRDETHPTKLLSSIGFPRKVNPDKVHAEIRDGMLAVRAPIAGVSKVKIFMPKAA